MMMTTTTAMIFTSTQRRDPQPLPKTRPKTIVSTFLAFLHPDIQDTVIKMTNLKVEGRARAPDGWRGMDRTWLRAYLGLLILSGIYRSRGEACESLWDPNTGRPLLRSSMSLKTFRAYCSVLRFDDRRTRQSRRRIGSDKLAAVRHVWDLWRTRLPEMYVPGPDVTVDERLVPFRRRCPFRQYMPNKPARYGLKIWVACDAKSSYTWQMQMYLGNPDN
ncbi:piggyBac transposable element-derived protein 4-like [Amphiprion ocellaris]|uniref:piggyBac transposable element-derived protein 4-like n=1 Tax=Amphiprion ocellaris TaxID=80972 RepID=UPI002410B8A0|nr:piggyBac transposable element-derived protein 4-like [Amphiprion ocellaris]XP_054861398.1 piggyBac transposable element-derived protein 4-like [Amphiprion ocellaris]